MDDIPIGALAVAMLAAIITVGFFSACETAMMALNRFRLRHLADKGDRRASRALTMLERPDRLIIMVLIGNNLLGAIAAALGTMIGLRLYGDTGVAIMTGIVAFLMMILADNAPKSLAAYYPEKVALPTSWILTWLLRLQHPVVWLLSRINSLVLRLFGVDINTPTNDRLTMEELRTVVLESHGGVPKRRHSMLLNVLDLEKVTVDDIMVPRHEVQGIDLDDSDEDIIAQLNACELTRLVVYRGELDNTAGILHMRMAGRLMRNGLDRESLLRHLQEPYFVPEGTPLHTQLFNFQKAKQRLGLVVDEYGVVQGIITLEDILEEIVGEFTSNIDTSSEDIQPQADGSWLIEGGATIRDINRVLDWTLPTDGPKTLNGLLVEQLESFPETGTSVKLGPYYFEILDVDEKMIRSARAGMV